MQRSGHSVAAKERDGQNQRHQGHSQYDQVVADVQDRALEMAYGVCFLHQLCSFPEVGVLTCSVNQRINLTLADDRAGINCLAGLACHRE